MSKDKREEIFDALKSYRTKHLRYKGDGGGMQLIDVLSPEGTHTGYGNRELELLADHIAYKLFREDQ